jgi:hypothetical protein
MLDVVKVVGAGVDLVRSAWRFVRDIRGDRAPSRLPGAVQPGTQLVRSILDRGPLELEIVPVSFEVSLNATVPSVEIVCTAINYTGKPVTVLQGFITRFTLQSVMSIDNLHIVLPVTVPSRRSHTVYFKRELVESQVQAIKRGFGVGAKHCGSTQISVHVMAGRKPVEFRTRNAQVVHGWISGLDPSNQ